APVILEGRDERAHVADMKQLAWTSACEHLRHYARVGAADEECRRLLARVDEVPVMFAVLREDLAPEAAQSFDEFVRHPGRIGGGARSGQAARCIRIEMRQERYERGPAYRTVEQVDGCEILVGKAAADNDLLTFRVAKPNDWWLHAAGYAGSHVVVRSLEGDTVPHHVLER